MSIFTVTGGTGYIGSKLIDRLVDEGHFVYASVRRGSSITDKMRSDSVSLFIYDGTESSLEVPIENSDYIIHLGASCAREEDEDSNRDLIDSNILFSTQLFNVARRVNDEVVISIASTFSSLDRNGEYSPETLYSATKTAVEVIAYYYGKHLSIHFLTFPDTYGPGDWRPKIHNLIVNNKEWPFEMISPSSQKMWMLHVEDVVGHLIHSLNDSSKGVKFHDIFADGDLISLGELSEILTDKECVFNDEKEVVEIPLKARDISKPTGYVKKHSKIDRDFYK